MSVWKQKAKVKGDGGEFEKPPPGNHPAVLVAIIDMGSQKQDFKGKITWPRRAFFCWELVTEKQAGYKDRNHVIGIDLTISLGESAKLRQWIEAREGRKIPEGHEYDISRELGKPCMLSVVEGKSGYPKIDGMKGVPKGMAVPPAQNKPFLWSLDDIPEDGSIDLPDWLPYLYGEPLADHIRRSKELTSSTNQDAEAPTETPESSIPF